MGTDQQAKTSIAYRHIKNVKDEGFEFNLVMRYVYSFYKKVMNGRVRKDSPESLMKYSRDWEYPWVLITSDIKPGLKTLDCGSGYSPVPFIWSLFGAESHAMDRDIWICSKLGCALRCISTMLSDIVKLPLAVKGRINKGDNSKAGGCDKGQPGKKNSAPSLIKSLYGYFILRNYDRISRLIKPDFWGPVSTRLLREYNVDYKNGDITSLLYEDNYFDVVSCVSVLEHMPIDAQIKGIKEMSRVVKKGGKLIITYDKIGEDLTGLFIKESGMKPVEAVYYSKPDNLYDKDSPDIIGISLVK